MSHSSGILIDRLEGETSIRQNNRYFPIKIIDICLESPIKYRHIVNHVYLNYIIIIISIMRAAHMRMAQETTIERHANAENINSIKKFFKDLFGKYVR